MIAGDGRFSHEVLAYVASNGCAFGLEAKSGVYLEDFEVDGFVDLHPPPEEHGLWRWSGDGAITDDGEVEFDGSWEALWTDQPAPSEPLRPVGGDEILLRVSRDGQTIVVDAAWPGTRATRLADDIEGARFMARGLADRAISAVIRAPKPGEP